MVSSPEFGFSYACRPRKTDLSGSLRGQFYQSFSCSSLNGLTVTFGLSYALSREILEIGKWERSDSVESQIMTAGGSSPRLILRSLLCRLIPVGDKPLQAAS
jgi:hypothetical protein